MDTKSVIQLNVNYNLYFLYNMIASKANVVHFFIAVLKIPITDLDFLAFSVALRMNRPQQGWILAEACLS